MELRDPRRRDEDGPAAVDPEQIAALSAMTRLSLGAAHALNNAFTAAMGETHFLMEEQKGNPQIVEVCEVVLSELERCARITRALLTRRHPSQAGGSEVDAGRLVSELGALLGETLGARHQLQVSVPDELLMVAGDARALELMVLSLVHYGADHAGDGSQIRLVLEEEPAESAIALRLFVNAQSLPEYVVDAFRDPSQAPDAVTGASLEAIASVVSSHGGSRSAAATAPDGWAALIHLPVLS